MTTVRSAFTASPEDLLDRVSALIDSGELRGKAAVLVSDLAKALEHERSMTANRMASLKAANIVAGGLEDKVRSLEASTSARSVRRWRWITIGSIAFDFLLVLYIVLGLR